MLNEEIRFATDADTVEIRKLWDICFPSEDNFNDCYFSRVYRPGNNLLLLQDNKLCAMAQMIPFDFQNQEGRIQMTYIYGACTHPDCRRQHMMDRLLHRTFEIDRQLGRAASFLIPQEAWLYEFYAAFGYKTCFYTTTSTFEAVGMQDGLTVRPMRYEDIPDCTAMYHRMTSANGLVVRPESYWKMQIDMFNNCGGHAFCIYCDTEFVGYTFVWHLEDGLWVQECMTEGKWRQPIADLLLDKLGGSFCRMTGTNFEIRSPIGCMLRYDGQQQPDGYLNLMLN